MVNGENTYSRGRKREIQGKALLVFKSVLAILKMLKHRKGLVFSKDSRLRLPESFYSLKGKRGTL